MVVWDAPVHHFEPLWHVHESRIFGMGRLIFFLVSRVMQVWVWVEEASAQLQRAFRTSPSIATTLTFLSLLAGTSVAD